MGEIRIGVLATLDSKHEAARFVCEQLEAAGVVPWLVDLSLRPHPHALRRRVGGHRRAARRHDLGRARAALARRCGAHA